MPTFSQIDVDVETENGKEILQSSVDFEVFCGGCGAGLCNQSDTRSSRRRQMPQVTVDPCEKCLEAEAEEAADKVRCDLEERIAELEREIDDAHKQMNQEENVR